MVSLEELREKKEKYEKRRNLRLLLLAILTFLVLPIIQIDNSVRLIIWFSIPIILGIHANLYIRQIDYHEMQQWGQIITPTLAALFTMVTYWFLLRQFSVTQASPITILGLEEPFSSGVLSIGFSLSWAYIFLIRPYQVQIAFIRRATALKDRIRYETRLTRLKDKVSELLRKEDKDETIRELTQLVNQLCDELRIYSQNHLSPEEEVEFVAVGFAKRVAVLAPVIGTILVGLVTELIAKIIF